MKMFKIDNRRTWRRASALTLSALTLVLITACTLFVDDDLPEELPTYTGEGYDAPVHEVTDMYDVTYQYKPTTKTLNSEQEVRHIIGMARDSADYFHILLYDLNTPAGDLPVAGQCLVSSNTDKFEHGIGDKVVSVRRTDYGHLVLTRHAALEELFDQLELEANLPVTDDITEYDYYDADSVLQHVTREERVKTRALIDHEFGLGPLELKFEGKPVNTKFFKMSMEGKLSWQLYAYVKIALWEDPVLRFRNEVEAGLTATLSIGAEAKGKKSLKKVSQFLAGKKDFLNGKVKWPIGPVVLVPKFGITAKCEASANAFIKSTLSWKYSGTFGSPDDPGLPKHEESSGPSLTVEGGVSGELDLPIISVHFGLGAYTNIIGVNVEVRGTLATVGELTESNDFLEDNVNEDEGLENESGWDVFKWAWESDDVHIDKNPKVSVGWKTELGISAGVDSDQLKEVKDAVEKAMQEIDDKLLTNEIAQAFLDQQIMDEQDYFLNMMNEVGLNDELVGQVADVAKDVISPFERRAQELEKEKSQLDKEKDKLEDDQKQVDKGSKLDELELSVGAVWTLPFATWEPIWETYIFPKMDDKTFRVGRKWNSDKSDLVFTAEYELEDPGYLSKWRGYYPGFLVKQGSKAIMFYPWTDSKGKPLSLNWDMTKKDKKDKGVRIWADLTGLSPDVTYTCIPGYATYADGKPTVFNKGISFSTSTPSLAIMDLEVKEVKGDMITGGIGNIEFNCKFDTHTHVKGLRNIREWGIVDNNDKNESTKYHKDKSAKAENKASNFGGNGTFLHHWTLKTKNTKCKVSLSPYIYAKDDKTSDLKNAKYFEPWEQTIDFAPYMTGSAKENSYKAPWAPDNTDDGSTDYELILDSVEFIPDGE